MYEVKHFCDCINRGLIESPIASKEATLEILKVFRANYIKINSNL